MLQILLKPSIKRKHLYHTICTVHKSFPGGSDGKESTCDVGDLGLIPGSERSRGEGNGTPLQCSCLENPHGPRSLVGCSPWGRKESDTTEQQAKHDTACFIFVWVKLERINFTALCILQKGIFNILRASCGYTDPWDITVRKNYIMSLACEWQRENCFLLQREKS